MAIATTYNYTIDLDKGGLRETLRSPLYTLNSKAHTFAITVKQGASAAKMSGAKCTGYFIRADGVTVPIDGTVSGNVASVTLLPNCYAVQGRFELSVDLTLGDVIHTILHVDGSILRSRTDSLTTGGSKVQSFDELVSAVQGVDAALKRRDRVVNLLGNSDFRNPVNQRGKTEYISTNGYTIDRWSSSSVTATIKVTGENLSICSTAGAPYYFYQRIEKKHIQTGKQYTFAICDSAGEIALVSAVASESMTYAIVYKAFAASGAPVNIRFGYSSGSGCYEVMLSGSHTNELLLLWAALYEGSYTADTLPEYQPKGYAVEMAECVRNYFPADDNSNDWLVGNAILGWGLVVEFPVKMRVTPSVVTIDGGPIQAFGSAGWVDVSVRSISMGGGKTYVTFPIPDGITVGDVCLIRGIAGLSADL